MRFVIVTGLSGAGKTTALKMLEDVGYFCVDNLPVPFIDKFVELTYASHVGIEKIALGVDVRSGAGLGQLTQVLEKLAVNGLEYEILFLDAEDFVLVKRYKETRRTHPLAGKDGRVDEGIQKERESLLSLKEHADYIINTSFLLTRELRTELEKIFVKNVEFKNIIITVLSFGFKYGVPADSDLVFDVRFLPNPYYKEELRKKTGNDKEVQEFVLGFKVSEEFLGKLEDMMAFLIPNYIAEGKNQLVVSIGCTGGKHRSVTLANKLFERLSRHDTYGVRIEHRDIQKDAYRKK